mmetsp:Transcript_12380/g.24774  ORF Transcript_12380/g.24774 Transcript_12380/m.24774 type:complete len:827 (+) Transcript_12380:479-2959(+)
MDIVKKSAQKPSAQGKKAKHGYDPNIYQTLPLSNDKFSGNIFECGAAHLRLDYVSGCTSCINGRINHEFRQRYSADATPHQDFRQTLTSNKNIGHGNTDSDYFAHDKEVTASNLCDWAVFLAKDYLDEWSTYFDSDEDFEQELEDIKKDNDHFSLIMVPVLARLLRCNIVLYLPNEVKPILFLPYPKVERKAAPQFGDYFRYFATLSLGSDMKFSLIISSTYKPNLKRVCESKVEEKFVKEEEEDEVESEEEKKKKKKIKYVQIGMMKNAKQLKPETSKITIAARVVKGSDFETEVKAMIKEAKKFLTEHFFKDKTTVYDLDDYVRVLWEKGYLRHRNHLYSSSIGTALPPWISNAKLTTYHPDKEDPLLIYTPSKKSDDTSSPGKIHIKEELRNKFKRVSIDNVRSLALKGSEEARKLLCHELDKYPTMVKGCNYISTFFHSTPMMLWSLHYLDKDYILVIPKEFGPIDNKKAMSGRTYLESLTAEDIEVINANNLCPCLLPGGLIPQSLHRSTTTHLDCSEDARSAYIYVGDTAAGAYHFSLMKPKRLYVYNCDLVHSLIAIPRHSLGKKCIHPIGRNQTGCLNLGYTSGIIRITNMYEVQNLQPWVHSMERGVNIKMLMSGCELCEPEQIIEMKENEESWKEKFGDTVVNEGSLPECWGRAYVGFKLDSRTEMTFDGIHFKGGKKKTPNNSEKDNPSDDDFGEEEISKSKKRAPAKASTSRKKKQQDSSDSDDDNMQSSKVAWARTSRACSTAKKPKYTDDPSDDDFGEEEISKSKKRAPAKATSRKKKQQDSSDSDDDNMQSSKASQKPQYTFKDDDDDSDE